MTLNDFIKCLEKIQDKTKCVEYDFPEIVPTYFMFHRPLF